MLNEAGMQPTDQFYYWMNVALAMTPRTDFEQLAQIMPWCMETSGYPQYVQAVEKAAQELGYGNMQMPESPVDGYALVTLENS